MGYCHSSKGCDEEFVKGERNRVIRAGQWKMRARTRQQRGRVRR